MGVEVVFSDFGLEQQETMSKMPKTYLMFG